MGMTRGLGGAALIVAAMVVAPAVGLAATEYEWHTITAARGRLDAVHAQIRDRVLPALGGHGLRGLVVLTPAGENIEGVVHVVVVGEGDSTGAAERGRLGEVPEWRALFAAAGDGGPAAVEQSMQRLRTTAWSPVPASDAPAAGRTYELRTYTCPDEARRAALLKRFENHTLKLFEKHGMTNVIYWVPVGSSDADTTLIYLLAHDSVEAAKASFDAFRKDPDWTAAKTASEAAAGGSLTNKEKGVVSTFLVPTDYSPLR
jgi:hypothetical protein